MRNSSHLVLTSVFKESLLTPNFLPSEILKKLQPLFLHALSLRSQRNIAKKYEAGNGLVAVVAKSEVTLLLRNESQARKQSYVTRSRSHHSNTTAVYGRTFRFQESRIHDIAKLATFRVPKNTLSIYDLKFCLAPFR